MRLQDHTEATLLKLPRTAFMCFSDNLYLQVKADLTNASFGVSALCPITSISIVTTCLSRDQPASESDVERDGELGKEGACFT